MTYPKKGPNQMSENFVNENWACGWTSEDEDHEHCWCGCGAHSGCFFDEDAEVPEETN